MKYWVFPFLLFQSLLPAVFADMPGNSPREAVSVLVRLGDMKGYTLYSFGDYSEESPIRDSGTIFLNGGFGAPPCVTFYGVLNDKAYTDSMTVCNEEQGDQVLTISVEDGLLVTKMENAGPVEDEVPALTNGVEDGADSQPGNPLRLLVLVALVSLVLLTAGYFITQRKRQAL